MRNTHYIISSKDGETMAIEDFIDYKVIKRISCCSCLNLFMEYRFYRHISDLRAKHFPKDFELISEAVKKGWKLINNGIYCPDCIQIAERRHY